LKNVSYASIEENKKYNSMDDMFRLVVCAPINELEREELNFGFLHE